MMLKEFMDYMRTKLGEREFHEYRQQFTRNHEMQFILSVLEELRGGVSLEEVKTFVPKRGRPPKAANTLG